MASPIYPVQGDFCWHKEHCILSRVFHEFILNEYFLHFKKLLFMWQAWIHLLKLFSFFFREREDSHFGAQLHRTCRGDWWSEKLTSFCCSQQVIHHVILQGFALLTLLSTWCPGMLLCILPQPRRKSQVINWGAGISEFLNENRRGCIWTHYKVHI